jgi:hypothetical protein
MNDLVTNGNKALAAFNGGGNPFTQAAEDLGVSEGVYLKFNGNTGEYTFGADQEELPEGTQLVAIMDSIARGFICWNDSEVIDEVMVSILDGNPPKESELTDHAPYTGDDDGWSEQIRIVFKDVETGETYTFKTSSRAAMRAVGSLMKDYGRQFKNHPDENPVIEISSSSYMPKEKKHGKKHAPILKIVGWMHNDEIENLSSSSSDQDDEGNYEQPAEEKTVTPTVTKEEAAPTGRRVRKF